jgi:ribosomal protein S18 acetylase RimI-like enzyme
MIVSRLRTDDLALIATIDRSEHVDVEYEVVDGQLTERPLTMADIPNWDPTGTGPFSVAAHIEFCASAVRDGAIPLGVVDGEQALGLAVIQPSFEGSLAWLVFLHVSRPYRRRGVARALWSEATQLATSAGADSMYVSATPTGSALGFYLSQGCRLADPVHPELYAKEPDDIHLICSLR